MKRGHFDPQLTEEEFKRIMEEVDAQLSAENVGIAGRELHVSGG